MDLTTLTITEAADLLARRAVSSVELTQAHLHRIAALDAQLNCFLTLDGDAALEQARAADAELASGLRRSELHGIPIALKDLFETHGLRTTAGSRFLRDHIPTADAVVVAKLRAAGAVNLGKLHMHEWALGVTGINPHYGVCRNPWDTGRITGGSSSGSGAALAARLCMGALGSDTGGSIRIPASLCGITGLKPTFGRVSTRGVVPLSWNLDHVGPMARTARDTALLLQAIVGYDAEDAYSANQPIDDYLGQIHAGVQGLRIGLASDAHFRNADPEVLHAVRAAAAQFEQLGAVVEEADLSMAAEAAPMNGRMTTSDAAAFHRDRLREHPELFGSDVRSRMEMGAAVTSTEYVLARRMQTLWRRRLDQLWTQFDLLLTPAIAQPAPLIDGIDAIQVAPILTRFTAPFNLAGVPVLALPCGFSSGGLPLGLQIVGAAWSEARILQAGHAYQAATAWHTHAPKPQAS